MTPVRVTAKLSGALLKPRNSIMLDALLMHRVATVEGRPPLDWQDVRMPEPEIPIARSACGRLFLASEALYAVECHEKGWQNRRFPMGQAQAMSSPKLKSILVGGGLSKSWRTPREAIHVERDEVLWFALGDRARVEGLLLTVSHLGQRRAVGLGRVLSWTVEDVEPWEGFPVLLDGRPLRPLPFDWPGLGEFRVDYRVLAPPYWERHRERECAVPG